MTNPKRSCVSGFKSWMTGPLAYLCGTYVLFYWGENMWNFALGLYLVYMEEGLLRMVAIFGFTSGVAIFLFGGVIGSWVDKNPRLKVVVAAVIIKDLCVVALSMVIFTVLLYESAVKAAWDGVLWKLLASLITLLAVLANLFGMAFKISIEKDWFVVVSGGNAQKLAKINSVTRSLDLACGILAPVLAGYMMTFVSLKATALAIAGYCFVTMLLEYFMLVKLYRSVPELANKRNPNTRDTQVLLERNRSVDGTATEAADIPPIEGDGPVEDSSVTSPPEDGKSFEASEQPEAVAKPPAKRTNCCRERVEHLALVQGWRVYAQQKVVFSGLALACLYMTVLSFHHITVGYVYSSGVSESTLGILVALSGLTGMLGAMVFPRLRSKVGLEWTGIIGFGIEILCLGLAVIAVWLPGSPFDPYFFSHNHTVQLAPNCTSAFTDISNPPSFTLADVESMYGANVTLSASRARRDVDLYLFYDDHECNFIPLAHGYSRAIEGVLGAFSSREDEQLRLRRDLTQNGDLLTSTEAMSQLTSKPCAGEDDKDVPTLSIVIFLIGVIASRIGLWIVDLTVAQTFQENISAEERGIVNGVQTSLNMVFEMIKYVLAMSIPHIETFGYLAMVCYAFICTGGALFLVHCWRTRREVFRCQCTPVREQEIELDGPNRLCDSQV